MDRSKLDMAKQETARLTVDTWGMSELKGTGIGEFNSGDLKVDSSGQEAQRRN